MAAASVEAGEDGGQEAGNARDASTGGGDGGDATSPDATQADGAEHDASGRDATADTGAADVVDEPTGAALGAPDASCGPGSWTSAILPPQGNDLLAAWASSANDVWAVGGWGTVLHGDGGSWSSTVVPWNASPPPSATAVWGSGPSDVYVASSIWVEHWDGTTWSTAATPQSGPVTGLAGTSASDVWATTGGTAAAWAFHWDGANWSSLTMPELAFAIWARTPTDAWAVGRDEILHWDGTAWTVAPAQTPLPSCTGGSIWASGASDAWAAHCGTLWRWSGQSWMQQSVPMSVEAVWGTASNDAWMAGDGITHWDGASLTSTASGLPFTVRSGWSTAPGDAWAVGDSGMMLHWSGSTWTRQPLAQSPVGSSFTAVWGANTADLWAVGQKTDPYGGGFNPSGNALLHWDGGAWSPMPDPLDNPVSSLWGSGHGNVWLASGELAHYDGTSWTHSAGAETEGAYVVAGSGSSDVWFATGHSVFAGAGSSWTLEGQLAYQDPPENPAADVVAMWVSGGDDAWALAETFVEMGYLPVSAFHWNGSSWTEHFLGNGVGGGGGPALWASGADDVWAVTRVGVVHWDGIAFSNVPFPDTVLSVWGTSANDVWLGGSDIFHWDGARWSCTIAPSGQHVTGLWDDSSGNVWAVTAEGAILHGP